MIVPILIWLGSLLSAAGTVPYILATVKGRVKPRLVTWLTWALLTGLAGGAALSAHQFGSAVFALIGTAATGSVVLVGLHYGDREFTKLDLLCMVIVAIGLVLWLVLDSPALAVWAAIVVDFVGLVPTLRHAWEKPQEESAITFAMVCAGGALTSAAVVSNGDLAVTALGYPFYVAASTGIAAAIIKFRQIILENKIQTEYNH